MLVLALAYPGSWSALTVSLSWSVLTVSLSSLITVFFHLIVALPRALPPPAFLLWNDRHCLTQGPKWRNSQRNSDQNCARIKDVLAITVRREFLFWRKVGHDYTENMAILEQTLSVST
jgi:hypothetical protein